MNIYASAYVIQYSPDQQTINPLPTGVHPQTSTIIITQGDEVVLDLVAVDGNGNPISLTGATFVGYVNAPLGGIVTIPNGQFAADPDQVNNKGLFTLAMHSADTSQFMLGLHKECLVMITSGGNGVYFRGFNLLSVYSTMPFQ